MYKIENLCEISHGKLIQGDKNFEITNLSDIYNSSTRSIVYFNDKKINYSIVDIYHENNISNNCLIVIKKNG